MGPTTLFDKSFLQSLSLDESVIFDNFFHGVICPLFFIETLADLEKAVRQGRTPEQEVGIIADKTPEMSGLPNVHHSTLALQNLLGQEIVMDGRVMVAGGRPVKVGDKSGVVFKESPEEEAFGRWQKRDFLHIEREIAKTWRQSLNAIDLNMLASGMRAMGIDSQNCKSLDEAKGIIESFISRTDNVPDQIKLARLILNAPPVCEEFAIQAWKERGSRAFSEYAPYAAHVVSVELFFQIALAANLIGTGRSSNRVDIAYLFYLPFCQMFVSSDNLHRRSALYFLRKDQSFIWGPNLKAQLKKLVEHYAPSSNEIAEQGLPGFAPAPPPDDSECLLTQLWDRHMSPSWRDLHKDRVPRESLQDADLVKELNRFTDAPTLPADQVDWGPGEAEMVGLKRTIRKRKGSFWQVPKDIADVTDKPST
jgi:hypothetical protein